MTEKSASNFWLNLLKKIAQIILQALGSKSKPQTNHQHVVPHPEGWAVKGEGNEKFTAVYEYQDDAVERAKDIARNYRSSVIIHREDGTIRDRISYR